MCVAQGLKPDQEFKGPRQECLHGHRRLLSAGRARTVAIEECGRYGNHRTGPITNCTDGTETVESRERNTDGTETADFVRSLFFAGAPCGLFLNTHAGKIP